MNLFNTYTRWPLYLAIAGLLLVSASAWYTNNLASQLADVEEKWVGIFRTSMEDIAMEENVPLDTVALAMDFTLQGEVITQMENLPRILVNREGDVIDGGGFGSRTPDRQELATIVKGWIEEGREPINDGGGNLMYIGESRLLQQLRYFPYVQGGLITIFVLIGFIGINQARKAEQERVWVGMA
ncbi:MAG: two-component sensor histidine kinase, partial [Bacteroidota bacterium]